MDESRETSLTHPARRGEPAWKIARSLESAEVGEVMIITHDGEIMSPERVRALQARAYLKLGAISATGGLVYAMLLASPLSGICVAAAVFGGTTWASRHVRAMRRAVTLLSAGERAAADRLLSGLAARTGRQSELMRGHVEFYRAKLAWQYGRFAEAAERYERAQSLLEKNRRRHAGMYWLCLFDRAELAACRGDKELAVTLRDELIAAPSGDYFLVERATLELLIAFYIDHTSTGIQDDLYELSKLGLQSNRLGLLLVLCGWAFADRGDHDMANFALAEAQSRLDGYFLADSFPELHAWMCAQRAAVALATDAP